MAPVTVSMPSTPREAGTVGLCNFPTEHGTVSSGIADQQGCLGSPTLWFPKELLAQGGLRLVYAEWFLVMVLSPIKSVSASFSVLLDHAGSPHTAY